MAESDDDSSNSPNTYGIHNQQGCGSNYQRHSIKSSPNLRPSGNQFMKEDDDDEFEEDEDGSQEEDDGDDQNNHFSRKPVDHNLDEDGDADLENDDDDEKEDKNDPLKEEDTDPAKSRRTKTLSSSYEMVPCAPEQSSVPPFHPKTSFGGRNSLTDWTEHETFALLDAWGDRFLQHGRKSLRSEEWLEVAEKVSEVSKIERTDTQCRNRIDTLKKKYKKEKMKLSEMSGETSKWVYFHKMDKLLSSLSQQVSLSCGLDPVEYVFMTPRVPFTCTSGFDATPGTRENSGSTGFLDDSDELPPKKRRCGRDKYEASSFRFIANSIQKFTEIYEKIENNKRQQLLELEKMRMDFFRELELQKRQILKRAQAEIAKIRLENDMEKEGSPESANV